MKILFFPIVVLACFAVPLQHFAAEPDANVTFNDQRVFAAYCGGFVPDGNLLVSQETKSFRIAIYWVADQRALYIFDLPREFNGAAWSRRIIEWCSFFDISAKGRLTAKATEVTKIQKRYATTPIALMSEFEIRSDDRQRRRTSGFPIGQAFVIPPGVSRLEVRYPEGEPEQDRSILVDLPMAADRK